MHLNRGKIQLQGRKRKCYKHEFGLMKELLVFSSPGRTPCREAWVELMLLLLDGMLERVEHLRGDLEWVGSPARFVDCVSQLWS